jgi:hypothetical protein
VYETALAAILIFYYSTLHGQKPQNSTTQFPAAPMELAVWQRIPSAKEISGLNRNPNHSKIPMRNTRPIAPIVAKIDQFHPQIMNDKVAAPHARTLRVDRASRHREGFVLPKKIDELLPGARRQ